MLKKYFNYLSILTQHNISSSPLEFLICFSELRHCTWRESGADPDAKRECPFHCCYPDLAQLSIIPFLVFQGYPPALSPQPRTPEQIYKFLYFQRTNDKLLIFRFLGFSLYLIQETALGNGMSVLLQFSTSVCIDSVSSWIPGRDVFYVYPLPFGVWVEGMLELKVLKWHY